VCRGLENGWAMTVFSVMYELMKQDGSTPLEETGVQFALRVNK